MVYPGGRSKGCYLCRQRRIKVYHSFIHPHDDFLADKLYSVTKAVRRVVDAMSMESFVQAIQTHTRFASRNKFPKRNHITTTSRLLLQIHDDHHKRQGCRQPASPPFPGKTRPSVSSSINTASLPDLMAQLDS